MKVTITKVGSGEYRFTSDLPGAADLTACSEVERLFPSMRGATTNTMMTIDIRNVETISPKPKLVNALNNGAAATAASGDPSAIVLWLQPDGHDQIDLMARNSRESWYVFSLRLDREGRMMFYRHSGIGSNSFIKVGGDNDYDDERIAEDIE